MILSFELYEIQITYNDVEISNLLHIYLHDHNFHKVHDSSGYLHDAPLINLATKTTYKLPGLIFIIHNDVKDN